MIQLRRHLLTDVLAVGARYPLVLAGECAVRAHGLVPEDTRKSSAALPLELATENPEPMDRIAAVVLHGLTELGWLVRPLETDPLSARLLVTAP
ncbi:hypothetical protein EAO75_45700, partial [Streptomyces sp. uw30]